MSSADPADTPPPPPTSPNIPPLRTAATSRKRPFQGSQGSTRRPPPPGFADYSGSILSERSHGYTTFEPELLVSGPTSRQNLRRSFHLTQLKRSSLCLEKRLVAQKIEEYELSLQALKERLLDVETMITSTTHTVAHQHRYMDQVGVPVPNMSEDVASSILYFEDPDISCGNSQDVTEDEDAATHGS